MLTKDKLRFTFYFGGQKYFVPTEKEIVVQAKVNFQPIPKRYRYSTRRLNYNPRSHRTPILKYPYLFDKNEVHTGYYNIPRFYLNNNKLKLAPIKHWGAPLNNADFNMSGNWPVEYSKEKHGAKGRMKIPKSVNLKAWLHYGKNQCNTSIIVGRMGSGKSMLMNFLINLCLGNNEAVIMGTDTFLEARHLALTGRLWTREKLPKKIKLPVLEHQGEEIPYEQLIIMTPIEIWYHEDSVVDWVNKKSILLPNINFHKFTDARQVLDSVQENKLVAVYDENLTHETQNAFWFEIAVRLNRRRNTDTTVTFCHHEASRLLPSHPSKGKFEDVQNFANEYIHFRKAEVRVIFAQQLLTESYWRTNKKTTYIFYKIGSRRDNIPDRRQRNKIQNLSLDKAVVERDGWWSEHNSPKFPEIERQSKLLFERLVRYTQEAAEEVDIKGYILEDTIKQEKQILVHKLMNLNKNEHIKKVRGVNDDKLLSRRTVSELFGIAPNTVKEWDKRGKEALEFEILKQLQQNA